MTRNLMQTDNKIVRLKLQCNRGVTLLVYGLEG